MLWTAWAVLAGVMIASNRWMKGGYIDSHLWIHRLAGVTILVITLWYAIYAWQKMGRIEDNLHSYFAFPVLFLVFFIAMGGIISRSCLRRKKWETHKALGIKKFHRAAAYMLIILGTAAIMTGIYYYRTSPKRNIQFPWEWVNLVVWLIVLASLEFSYRCSLI